MTFAAPPAKFGCVDAHVATPPSAWLRPLAASLMALTLAACGGGGSDSGTGTGTGTGTTAGTSTGVFLDSPVAGVDYYIGGAKAGTTNALGQFSYTPGDVVTFKLGAVTLGTASGASLATVTPADLSADSTTLQNILVLLQSLDSDNNPANGINILPADAALLNAAADLTALNAATDVLSAKLPGRTPVSNEAALTHFTTTVASTTPAAVITVVSSSVEGAWYSGCVGSGSASVIQWEAVPAQANKIHFAGKMTRTYANADCSGTYTEVTITAGTTQSDYSTYLGAQTNAGGSITARVLSDDGEGGAIFQTHVLSADRKTVTVAEGRAGSTSSWQHLTAYGFPASTAPVVPVVPVAPVVPPVTATHLLEQGLGTLNIHSGEYLMGIVTLDFNSSLKTWRANGWDFARNLTWQRYAIGSNNAVYLSSNGTWLPKSPEFEGTYQLNSANELTASSVEGGDVKLIPKNERDLTDVLISTVVPGGNFAEQRFPAGAKSYDLEFTNLVEDYFLDEGVGDNLIPDLQAMVSLHQTSTSNWREFLGMRFSFDSASYSLSGGSVTFWSLDTATVLGQGQYRVTVDRAGNEILIISAVPAAALTQGSEARSYFDRGIRAMSSVYNGEVHFGEMHTVATYVDPERYFNRIALGAIAANRCPVPDVNGASVCADGRSGILSVNTTSARALAVSKSMRVLSR